MPGKIACIAFALAAAPAVTAAAQNCPPSVIKVPCRDMGDGRTLVDSSYLPDSFVMGKSRYSILRTGPTSMSGEWANRVCTIRIS